MLLDLQRQLTSGDLPVGQIKCPLCRGNLLRERRRMVDRLRSVFAPVKRYRCENFSCQWQGNFANPRSGYGANGRSHDAPARSHANRRSGRVPIAFVMHMVLVAVGIVFVLVFSSIEPTYWVEEKEQVVGPGLYEAVPALSVDRTATR